MTKSKTERLVDYAIELCGEEDAPGYLSMATGASILKVSKNYNETEETLYACIREILTVTSEESMGVDILAALIGRIIYESPMNVDHVKELMYDSALASIRGALNKKVMDNV